MSERVEDSAPPPKKSKRQSRNSESAAEKPRQWNTTNCFEFGPGLTARIASVDVPATLLRDGYTFKCLQMKRVGKYSGKSFDFNINIGLFDELLDVLSQVQDMLKREETPGTITLGEDEMTVSVEPFTIPGCERYASYAFPGIVLRRQVKDKTINFDFNKRHLYRLLLVLREIQSKAIQGS